MAEDQGLPMTSKRNPEELQQEVQQLEELQQLPLIPKTLGYIKRCGPGLLQSAMTLGAGSAAASVAAGAAFGYKLLWVQPLAMFFGVCMLAALSNVVLTKQERPYKAFGRETSKILVFLWALGTIMSSVIWHFPQYSLCSGAIRDLYEFTTNTQLAPVVMENGQAVVENGKVLQNYTPLWYIVGLATGITVLCINIFTVWSYGSSAKGVKLYERFLQCTIALVIISFGIVVCCNIPNLDWKEIFKGFTGYYAKEVLFNSDGSFNATSLTMVLGMLGAAVGINMTFLYPYSQLAKGWGPAHKTLAKWDLGMTMFLPFTLVTSLIILAMTVGGVEVDPEDVATMQPLTASKALVDILGPTGRVIFDLGLFGMTCGAVSTHMVVCGFTVCEMFGLEYTKWRFRLFALVPTVGMFGVLVNLPFWLPVMASAVCLTMLPIAYLLFVILNNKRSYIGDAVGKGWKRVVFNVILLVALVFTVIASGIKINDGVIKKINPPVASHAVPAQPEVVLDQKFKPTLYATLPDYCPVPDGMTLDEKTNIIYLNCPNYVPADENGKREFNACLMQILPDGTIEKIMEYPTHPETGKAGPMGLDICPSGNLYVCDNQRFSTTPQGEVASRILRVARDENGKVIFDENGKPDVRVVVEGLNLANALLWDGDNMFVTDTVVQPQGEVFGCGGIWKFTREEIEKAVENNEVIKVSAGDKQHLILTAPVKKVGRNDPSGADGMTKAWDAIYFGNFGDGVIRKVTFDAKGKTVVEVVIGDKKDNNNKDAKKNEYKKFQCCDGMFYDRVTDLIYINDSQANAIRTLDKDDNLNILWMNPNTDGADGSLDQPAECIVRDGKLIIANFDWSFYGLTNEAHDKPYTLSVIDVSSLTKTATSKDSAPTAEAAPSVPVEAAPSVPAEEPAPSVPAEEPAPSVPAEAAPATPAEEAAPSVPAEAAPATPAEEAAPSVPVEAAPATPAEEAAPSVPAEEAAA